MMKRIENLYTLFLECTSVSIDTRNITKGAMFFCLKGDSFNGNTFAEEAIKKGALCVVVDEKEYMINNKCFLVENVLESLQALALFHRNKLDIPIVGITGTNGKTTTKELIREVLSKKFKVVATQGNYNNHIGVPLTMLSISEEAEIAVVEMGANHQGEIRFLCNITDPDYGIITNIGKAHLDGFGGFEGVIKTKKELYEHITKKDGKIFIFSDDVLLTELSDNIESICYGTSFQNDIYCKKLFCDPYLALEWIRKEEGGQTEKLRISTRIVGDYNFQNVTAAICVGDYFNVPKESIIAAISEYIPKNNRSQFIETKNNKVVLDAYNANPDSVKAAINNFVNMKFDNKIVVLGDMLELGDDAVSEHEQIAELLSCHKSIEKIFVGEIFSSIEMVEPILQFRTTEDAISYIKKNPYYSSALLIKGSRGIGLEKIIDYL